MAASLVVVCSFSQAWKLPAISRVKMRRMGGLALGLLLLMLLSSGGGGGGRREAEEEEEEGAAWPMVEEEADRRCDDDGKGATDRGVPLWPWWPLA